MPKYKLFRLTNRKHQNWVDLLEDEGKGKKESKSKKGKKRRKKDKKKRNKENKRKYKNPSINKQIQQKKYKNQRNWIFINN